jgi:hypothetical protein
MSWFKSIKLLFSPLRLVDAEFGDLLFMYIRNAPKESYWECTWKFPATGTTVFIGIPGDEAGPYQIAREFFLALPERFESIITACRPRLQEVFSHWFQTDLPADIFSVLKLTAFGVEVAKKTPLEWDVSFETTGPMWLSITVPFVGETPQEACVDT